MENNLLSIVPLWVVLLLIGGGGLLAGTTQGGQSHVCDLCPHAGFLVLVCPSCLLRIVLDSICLVGETGFCRRLPGDHQLF